jgi:hypothetical protein
MTDKDSTNNNSTGEIEYKLHQREIFSSPRQIEEPDENPRTSEANRFLQQRHGTSFKINKDLITPEIKDNDLFGLVESNEQEISTFAHELFDSKNLQQLSEANGAKQAIKDQSASYERRQRELESVVEGVSPIRSLLSSVKLVSPSMFHKIFVPIMAFFIVVLIFLEWGSQAVRFHYVVP